jgi:hypothetical protein
VIDKERHMQKRKVLSQALSGRALKSMECALDEKLMSFSEQLFSGSRQEKKWSNTKNMAETADYLTFDLMGDFCFGKSFDVMNKVDNRHLLKVISDGIHALSIVSRRKILMEPRSLKTNHLQVGHVPGLLRFGIGNLFFPRLIRGLHEYKAYSKQLADDCLEGISEKESGSIFRLLLEETKLKNGGDACFPELVSESSLLLIAGKPHFPP